MKRKNETKINYKRIIEQKSKLKDIGTLNNTGIEKKYIYRDDV